MEQYSVSGMSCAACSARVEKAVSKVPGVTSCSVSLLTNSMGVEGSASQQAVIAAVKEAGYEAALKGRKNGGTIGMSEGTSLTENGDMIVAGSSIVEAEDVLADRETPGLKRRLIASIVFLIVLMYVSMGHMMWNWPLPGFFARNHVAVGLLQLLLTAAVMVINQKFFISGFKSLMHKAPNMDTLVALGAAAAFAYSTVALFAMADAQQRGDAAAVMEYMHEFYFESAAMILALITVGKMLEARSKGKTTDALKGLMKLAPKTANVERGGQEITVPIEQVRKGDIFFVRPGENIPVDGVVLEGSSAVNEAALTGESIPADKIEGDLISAATLNQSGYLKCEATRVGEDTTLSRIIQMVSDAAATKAPIAKIADKVSGVFVPIVISIAIVTTIVWLLVGQPIGFALARGISVLVISCPCALGLATPVAIMVGNGMGAKHGIMFKTAVSLEETGKIEIVALDKTGTITCGEPRVTDVIPAEGYDEETLLALAYALERKSEHPLARAIVDMVKGQCFVAVNDEPSYHPGRTAKIFAGNTEIGILGEIHPTVAENYSIDEKVYAAKLNVAAMYKAVGEEKMYHQLPKFPAVTRDLSMLCDEALPVAEIKKAIATGVGDILESIELFDVYRGSQIPEGKKSVAYSFTLRSDSGTLSEKQCTKAVNKAIAELEKLGAEIRS